MVFYCVAHAVARLEQEYAEKREKSRQLRTAAGERAQRVGTGNLLVPVAAEVGSPTGSGPFGRVRMCPKRTKAPQ